jgi:transposase
MTTAELYIGVDVAKATLAVATTTQFLCEVSNSPDGVKKLITQLGKLSVKAVVLESTGVYGQALVEALMLAGYSVAVVQPGRVRHFAKSQNQHAKTDAIDAQMIARYAESTELRFVEKTSENIVELRALIDRREQIILMRVSEENHLEANRCTAVIKEIKMNITRLEKQEKEYNKKIKALIAADEQLAAKQQLLEQEAGIGAQTSATLIANLPELGTVNRQQIAALAGLAPYNNDSGTMRGKRAIYGGRKRLRKALYLAAVTAVKWSEWLRTNYVALCKKGKLKKVALIACARKLLIRLNSLLAAAYKKTDEVTLST